MTFLALEGITKRIKHFRTQSTYNSLILQSENELHGPNRLKQNKNSFKKIKAPAFKYDEHGTINQRIIFKTRSIFAFRLFTTIDFNLSNEFECLQPSANL